MFEASACVCKKCIVVAEQQVVVAVVGYALRASASELRSSWPSSSWFVCLTSESTATTEATLTCS